MLAPQRLRTGVEVVRNSPVLPIFVWLLACLASSGCGSFAVSATEGYQLFDAVEASLSGGETLSPRTLQTLRQLDLEAAYRESPRNCFQRLQAEAEAQPQADRLFALAEMSYLLAQQADHTAAAESCCLYYLCAAYSYHYLFDDQAAALDESRSPYDPRFRLACDLYNVSLAHCIRRAQQMGRLDPSQQVHLPTMDGKGFMLTVQHHGFRWPAQEFGPLLFCADHPAEGLVNQHRNYGLGVPLIGTRAGGRPIGKHACYPDAVSYPVTAFFRFDGSLADLHRQRSGVLELYNPLEITRVNVAGRSVALETDLTTPLAYFLAHSDLQATELQGFLHPDALESRAGIYMLEPYQPGKIPVIMIHGLLSSPLTWAPMFNDLRADPELRKHFQFWFYLYPTGPGYLQAAGDLRQDFAQLRDKVDPQHGDGSLDRVVMVGHSMGGLVSRLMTVDSGEDFLHLVSKKPVEELPIDPAARAELNEQLRFERQPWVRRVIFVGTPHRGSKLGPSVVGRVASNLVHLPGVMLASAQELARTNPLNWGAHSQGKPPTSVDLLSPGSPFLQLLAAEPRPRDVHFHSIIGQALPRTLLRELTRPILGNEKTDGVVPYSSAHLDGVDSELIVTADHLHVHHHPLAIREVRRILLEHWNEEGSAEDREPVAAGRLEN